MPTPDLVSPAVSLETIARELKVSKVTVSNALRGTGRISEATRARVVRTATALGYRPNPLVTALMSTLRRNRSSRRCTLAFLNFFPGRDDWLHHPTFVQFYRGAERRARELGYRVELHWQGEVAGNLKRLGNILYARGIPGVVIAPLPSEAIDLDIGWSRFATVAIGHTFRGFAVHRASNHQLHTIRLAVDKLVAHGLRRIGLLVSRDDDLRVEHAWLAGFIAAQRHHELPPIAPLMAPDFNAETVVAWVREQQVDAVVGTNHHIVRWLRAAGIRVPEDVGFAHLDWAAEKDAAAGVDQRSGLVGAAAVDLLIEQLNNNETGVPSHPKSVLIDSEWHDGPTLRLRSRSREKSRASRAQAQWANAAGA